MTKPKPKPSRKKQQILDDHERIRALLAQLAAAAEASATCRCLDDLQPLLQRHFRDEEAEIDGLHAGIRQRTPQFWNALCGLRDEHVQLLAEAGVLRQAAGAGTAPEQLRALGHTLQQRVAAHEAKETELFVESIWTDLGEGD